MKIIGGISILFLFLCVVLAFQNKKIQWLLPAFWFFMQILGTIFFYQDKFSAPFFFLMAVVSAIPIAGVGMWNVKARKKISTKRLILFIGVLLFFCFLISRTPAKNVIYNLLNEWYIGQIQNYFLSYLKIILVILFLVFIAILMTFILIGFFDRMISKKEQLILIQCKTFSRKCLLRFYYLEGIHNGQKYFFCICPFVYRKMKGKSAVEIKLYKGCFGGQYVLKVPLLKK